MAGLVLKLTDAGLAAVQAAAGSDPVVIAELGLTGTAFDYAPTLTALPGEFKRIGAVSGVAAAANIAHLTAYDTSADTWTATGLGLYLSDGTLFAVHASDVPVQSKASLAFALVSIDIIFNADLAADIAFGNAIFTNPPATTDMRGLVELTTDPEAIAGEDALRAVPAKGMKAAFTSWINARFGEGAPSAFVKGLLGLADKAAMRGALDLKSAALKDEGAGNGLDADLLDGQQGSFYTDIPARLGYTPWGPDNDGAGSGLDADLLDGQQGSYYTNIPARLGFTPMNTNKYDDFLRDVGSNLAENGYMRFSNGLMMCWGRFTATGNAQTTVTFPLAFPTACFSVVAGGSSDWSTGAQDNWPAVNSASITRTSFGVYNANDSADACTFLAVGY